MPSYQLFLGDCAEVMKNFPDDYIDLTITSPPYDNLRDYKGYIFDFEVIAKELYRITKPGGVVVWVVNDATIDGSETGTSFDQALYFKRQCGFKLYDTMVYEKENFMPLNHKRYEQQFEFMFVLSKGPVKTFNPLTEECKTAGNVYNLKNKHSSSSEEKCHAVRKREKEWTTKETKTKGNIWGYQVGNKKSAYEDYVFNHPAPFPEGLARDHILSWSNPGDLVFDPMCGSGTVGKMAGALNRNFIGIEISEYYLEEIARPRIDAAYRQEKLFAEV